jgi:acetyl esterase/lipase
MTKSLLALHLVVLSIIVQGQTPEHIRQIFPNGTVFHSNIPYAGDTIKKHQLDIYLPRDAKSPLPLVVWVHGGAWRLNDKYADMSYMKNTIQNIVHNGFALASIDYRHSTTEKFPAQIKDCIQAVQFLHDNAGKYRIDKSKIILMGFSAGGHLASLLALSLNDNVKEFYPLGNKPTFSIKAVLDFYGPSDLLMFYGNSLPGPDTSNIGILLGASPLLRPDLSKKASPVTYIDKGDPPFFIVHGEKDDAVPPTQSHLLKSYLDLADVKNELFVVKGAPHYGEMFDTQEVQDRLFLFLKNEGF